ncbi:hypothetical protein K402DRAFT_399135 [Aulographum hederae CBS 113979]|uniref:Uncharacterized protein n=1 Tax=Aulographum hederae CBS 113979 TaxID=1176131 RepID=A0A6G1GIL7_9PEZI|nr:hypothetical protein K402DRAFT_399135 [Aulographum hederae CBS 113979]
MLILSTLAVLMGALTLTTASPLANPSALPILEERGNRNANSTSLTINFCLKKNLENCSMMQVPPNACIQLAGTDGRPSKVIS